jgi:DNA repair exonuclease SbcCD nuclease subunit
LESLTGVDLSILENTRTDLQPTLNAIYTALHESRPDFNSMAKKPIRYKGQTIRFPKFEFTTFGQKAMVNSLLDSSKPADIVADVFAIYLQPVIEGKFDSKRVPEIKKEVLSMRIIFVWPWVAFFFRKLSEHRWSSTRL